MTTYRVWHENGDFVGEYDSLADAAIAAQDENDEIGCEPGCVSIQEVEDES